MGKMELEIMKEFPLLATWRDNTYWTGFINSQGLLLRVSVSAPKFPSCEDLRVNGDADSVEILGKFQDDLDKVIQGSVSVLEVLRGVKDIVEKYKSNEDLGSVSKSRTGNESEFLTAIFNELEQIGCENVESASETFTELGLRCFDEMNRKHILRFNIPPLYPRVGVKVVAELPSVVTTESLSWPKSLVESYEKFRGEIGKYVKFWDMLDELDSETRVIDPTQPNRSDCYRRILMNQSVVVQLTLNPLSPRGFPEIQFSGPERNVRELEAILDQDCKDWKEGKTVLENLKDILKTEFLRPLSEEDLAEGGIDDLQNNCVICYAFEFEGKLPETSCDCGSIYHDKCLSDLLINDCSVKARRLCVDCPVCGVELKVSNAEKATW